MESDFSVHRLWDICKYSFFCFVGQYDSVTDFFLMNYGELWDFLIQRMTGKKICIHSLFHISFLWLIFLTLNLTYGNVQIQRRERRQTRCVINLVFYFDNLVLIIV